MFYPKRQGYKGFFLMIYLYNKEKKVALRKASSAFAFDGAVSTFDIVGIMAIDPPLSQPEIPMGIPKRLLESTAPKP